MSASRWIAKLGARVGSLSSKPKPKPVPSSPSRSWPAGWCKAVPSSSRKPRPGRLPVLRAPVARVLSAAVRVDLRRAWALHVPAGPWDHAPVAHPWGPAVPRAASVPRGPQGLAASMRVDRIGRPLARSKGAASDPRRRSRPGLSPRSVSAATGIGAESSTTTSPALRAGRRGDVM